MIVSGLDTPVSDQTVRLLAEDTDHIAWNQFVGALPEGDVLQAWEWGGIKSPDWTPVRIGVFQDGKLIAGAALLRRKLPVVGNFYYAPRGPLLYDWNDSEVLSLLMDAIRERARVDDVAFLKIDPAIPIDRADVRELLQQLGFQEPHSSDAQGFGGTQPRCVMQLDLLGQSEQDLLAAFKAQTRRNIKLSTEKHGVTVVDNLGRDALQIFNDLMVVTGERDGFRPRPLSYFQALWDNLASVGLLKLFLTEYEGEYLSGALCFKIGDKAWYVYGASSNEHRNVMPNYAMQWAMIRWARAEGCRWYDFRGVSPRRRVDGEDVAELEKEDHLQGLNRFKEGFSPRYVEYIGEFDLVYKPVRYQAFTYGKPMAQKILRRLRSKS